MTVLLSIAVIGVMDWLFHFDDSGVRFLLLMTTLVIFGWVVWKRLAYPLLFPLNHVAIAQAVERRYPSLQDQLSSSIDFINNADPRSGSLELQNRVIDETISSLHSCDLNDVVDSRIVRRSVVSAMTIAVLIGLLANSHPLESKTAMARLFEPLQRHAWPKSTELRFLDSNLRPLKTSISRTLQVAQGSTVELFLENTKGALPDNLRIQYRFADGQIISEAVSKTALMNADNQRVELGHVEVSGANSNVEFRAVGGDDVLPWYTLQTVRPPRVASIKVRLTPPDYLGQPAVELPPDVGHLEAYIGTVVEIEARSTHQLDAATLHRQGVTPQPLQLSANQRSIATSFTIDQPGLSSYWFVLTGLNGLEDANPPRYEIRGISDTPPEIYFDHPPYDMQVSRNAVVPLRIVAKDDLGLGPITLHFQIQDGASESATIPLFDGHLRPVQTAISHDWDLSQLPLDEGYRIAIRAVAEDDFDLSQTRVGMTETRILTIVSDEAKLAELSDQQSDLLEEIERIMKIQQLAHDQTNELKQQLDTVGRLRPADLDLLKRVELDQQQVAARLFDPRDGVDKRVRSLLEELGYNQLSDPQLQKQLLGMHSEFAILRDSSLPTIERELTHAHKAALQNAAPSDSTGSMIDEITDGGADGNSSTAQESLESASVNQRDVLQSLRSMRDTLSKWQKRRLLSSDLADLTAAQESLNRDTTQVAGRTLTKPFESLSAQDQAELAKVSGRQRSQWERLEEFTQQLKEAIESTDSADRATAELFHAVEGELHDRAIGSQMLAAVEQLAINQVGQAMESQQGVVENLRQLKQILDNQSAQNGQASPQDLNLLEKNLRDLRQLQEDLLTKTKQLRSDESRQPQDDRRSQLADSQEELLQNTQDTARKLRRTNADRASEFVDDAADFMQKASSLIRQAELDIAERRQTEALNELKAAEREIANQRQRISDRLVDQTYRELAAKLESIAQQQQQEIDDTTQLDSRYQTEGKWNRQLLKSLRDVVIKQGTIKQLVTEIMQETSAAEILGLALQGAYRDMETAERRLFVDRDTGSSTIAYQQSAKQRLLALVSVLNEGPPNNRTSDQKQPSDQQNNSPQSDSLHPLTQLKLIKVLQENIQSRTEKLSRVQNKTEDDLTRIQQLADEQQQLLELFVSKLSEAAESQEPSFEAPVEGQTSP